MSNYIKTKNMDRQNRTDEPSFELASFLKVQCYWLAKKKTISPEYIISLKISKLIYQRLNLPQVVLRA